jgi:hypothetical protein
LHVLHVRRSEKGNNGKRDNWRGGYWGGGGGGGGEQRGHFIDQAMDHFLLVPWWCLVSGGLLFLVGSLFLFGSILLLGSFLVVASFLFGSHFYLGSLFLLVSLFLFESLFSSLILSFLFCIPSDTCTLDYHHLTIPPHFTLSLRVRKGNATLCQSTNGDKIICLDQLGRMGSLKAAVGLHYEGKAHATPKQWVLEGSWSNTSESSFSKKYFLVKIHFLFQKNIFFTNDFSMFLCQK